MPTPIPKIPADWRDDKVVPAKTKSQADVKALMTLAKLSRTPAVLASANKLNQKYGNWLAFETKGKNDLKAKIAPEVIKLYRAALAAVKRAPLPTGKYKVALTNYTRPKFMHNATQAGTLPTWTFEFCDEGQPHIRKSFTITMTNNMYGDENHQAEQMSDAAVATIKRVTKATVVKVVKDL